MSDVLFGSKPAVGTPSFGQSTPAFCSPFGAPSASAFESSSTMSLFGASSTPAFSTRSAPLFASSSTPSFGFSSAAAATTPMFNTGLSCDNSQSAGPFMSSPATGQTSPLRQPNYIFGQSLPSVGSSLFGGKSDVGFAGQSTGFGGSLFGVSPSLTHSSTHIGLEQPFSSPSQPSACAPASSGISIGNFGQMQPAGFGGTSNTFCQSPTPPSASQPNIVYTPAPLVNPFGTLPPAPQQSISRSGGSSSNLYGICNMPVSHKRMSSFVTPRHFSHKKIRLPPRSYPSKISGPRVPFFLPEEEVPTTPKADALFIQRENPRALDICPIEQWPPRLTVEGGALKIYNEKVITSRDVPVSAENGTVPKGDGIRDVPADIASEHGVGEAATAIASEHGAGEAVASIAYENGTGEAAAAAAITSKHGEADDIEALMPKLRHPEYYTEPPVEELAAKERATPGFCRHVKDFIVGRHGYGSIKFEGETDVRRLDLEDIVEFNHREVIVYKDARKKPPLGEGLNKPGEVTLLNVKHVDRKTGHHFTEGPKIESFCKMLEKKAEEEGAKYVSYEPVKGEWKFKVDHF